jgi:predicted DNA-binding transcriptional regulator AlpA
MTSKAEAAAALLRTGLSPRGLSREQASAYVGVSPTYFDALVARNVMPPARRLGGRHAWDIRDLDKAFDRLPQTNDEAGPASAPAQDRSRGDDWDKMEL